SPLFFDFNNDNTVYVSSNQGRDKAVITKLDLKTGKEIGQPIFSHNEVDVEQLGYSRLRKVPTAISYTTDKRHLYYLDKLTEERYEFLQKQLPGYEVVVASTNKAEDKFMVRTYSDRS